MFSFRDFKLCGIIGGSERCRFADLRWLSVSDSQTQAISGSSKNLTLILISTKYSRNRTAENRKSDSDAFSVRFIWFFIFLEPTDRLISNIFERFFYTSLKKRKSQQTSAIFGCEPTRPNGQNLENFRSPHIVWTEF